MTKIGFIGAGQMASALARGFVAADQILPEDVYFCDPSLGAVDAFRTALPGAHLCAGPQELVDSCDLALLAVKPQHIDSVFARIERNGEVLFVSIAAGVSLAKLMQGVHSDRVIRVMPNTPCLVGAGAAGFCCGSGVTDNDRKHLRALLNSVGVAHELPERLLDSVTGLSGSGPAFVYQVIEALSDGGVSVGLPREVATELAAQTVLGAAKMVLETGEHPGALKDKVTSPGGTTIAGLFALESGGIRAAFMDAVRAATERSQELRGKS